MKCTGWGICGNFSFSQDFAAHRRYRRSTARRSRSGSAIVSRLTLLLRDIAARAARVTDPSKPPRAEAVAKWHGQLLPLVSPGFPIAVCWSAKAGCTTVLKWFLAHSGLLEEALAYSSWVHDYREQRLNGGHDYFQRCVRLFDGTQTETLDTHTETFIIKVIRNPAARAVSSFLHFLRHERSPRWTGGATIGSWKQAVGLGRQPGLSFRQFLHFVADEQRLGHTSDPHFRPQFTPLQDFAVHAHLPLEHLAAGLAELEDIFRLRHVDVRKLSVSEHHNPPSTMCHWPDTPSAFPADLDTLATYGTPPTAAFLDPETCKLVQQAYTTDYDAYGWIYPTVASPIYPATLPLAERGARRPNCDQRAAQFAA